MANQKGFTLVRLVFTIVIIGIFIAFLAPKFKLSMDKDFAGQTLYDIATAEQAYWNQHTHYIASVDSLALPSGVAKLILKRRDVTFSIVCQDLGFIATAQHEKFTMMINEYEALTTYDR